MSPVHTGHGTGSVCPRSRASSYVVASRIDCCLRKTILAPLILIAIRINTAKVNRMTVARKMRAWRESLGLTQRQAAKRAGVSQAVWSKLESGRSIKGIGLRIATRIVRACGGTITLMDLAA